MPKDRLCLVVCEGLARETAAAIAAEHLDDTVVTTFPARCGAAQVDWETLAEATSAPDRDCSLILLLGPCGAAGSGPLPKQLEGSRLYRFDSCSSLFIGTHLVDHYVANGACLLIPAELAQGWDNPGESASSSIAGRCASASRLVLLDTGVDSANAIRLEELAQAAGRPSEILPVGLDFYRLFLARIVQEWRQGAERNRSTAALSEAIRRSSDHAMALDMIGNLTRTVTEAEAIEGILELFIILFAPGRLIYLPWREGQPGQARSFPASSAAETALPQPVALEEDYVRTASGKGFTLRIGHQNETLGLLEIDEIAFPEHIDHYLNLALILARVSGLAISNARTYEKSIQAEEKVRHQAYHDALTGLPNRLLFNDLLAMALAQARRSLQSLAVMFIDLDHFKRINDTLGHDVGDQLLQQVAGRLQNAVRGADTLARMGGDEFLLLLPVVNQPEDALRVAERVLWALRAPFPLAGREIQVTASVGIAICPRDGHDVATLLKNADTALYRVKDEGRNGCRLYGE